MANTKYGNNKEYTEKKSQYEAKTNEMETQLKELMSLEENLEKYKSENLFMKDDLNFQERYNKNIETQQEEIEKKKLNIRLKSKSFMQSAKDYQKYLSNYINADGKDEKKANIQSKIDKLTKDETNLDTLIGQLEKQNKDIIKQNNKIKTEKDKLQTEIDNKEKELSSKINSLRDPNLSKNDREIISGEKDALGSEIEEKRHQRDSYTYIETPDLVKISELKKQKAGIAEEKDKLNEELKMYDDADLLVEYKDISDTLNGFREFASKNGIVINEPEDVKTIQNTKKIPQEIIDEAIEEGIYDPTYQGSQPEFESFLKERGINQKASEIYKILNTQNGQPQTTQQQNNQQQNNQQQNNQQQNNQQQNNQQQNNQQQNNQQQNNQQQNNQQQNSPKAKITKITISAKDNKVYVEGEGLLEINKNLNIEAEEGDSAIDLGKKLLNGKDVKDILTKIGIKSKFAQFLAKKKINPVVLAAISLNGDSGAISEYIQTAVNLESYDKLFDYNIYLEDSALSKTTNKNLKKVASIEKVAMPDRVTGTKASKFLYIMLKHRKINTGISSNEPPKLSAAKAYRQQSKLNQNQNENERAESIEEASKKIDEYIDSISKKAEEEFGKEKGKKKYDEQIIEILRKGPENIAKFIGISDITIVTEAFNHNFILERNRGKLQRMYKQNIFKTEYNEGESIIQEGMLDVLSKCEKPEDIVRDYFQTMQNAKKIFDDPEVKRRREERGQEK